MNESQTQTWRKSLMNLKETGQTGMHKGEAKEISK